MPNAFPFPNSSSSPSGSNDLRASFVAHALLIAVFCWGERILPPAPLTPRVPILKVDLVDLPDILKKDQKSFHLSPAPLAPTAPPELASSKLLKELKAAEKSASRVQAEARALQKLPQPNPPQAAPSKAPPKPGQTSLQKLRALDRIAQFQAEVEADTAADATKMSETLQRVQRPIRGNRLSSGLSSSPEARESDASTYLDTLREAIRAYWILPAWLAGQDFRAVVSIQLDPRGYLKEFHFTRSSENPQFDQAVKQAIQDAQPLPLPPVGSEERGRSISIGFPL
jgi:TonB family protein